MKFDKKHGKPNILMRLFVRFLLSFLSLVIACDAIEFVPQTMHPWTVKKKLIDRFACKSNVYRYILFVCLFQPSVSILQER